MAQAKWFKRKAQVRYRDTDSAGHVHHGVYLHYLEDARIDFLQKLLGAYGISDIDFVLAMLEINYKSRAGYRDSLDVMVRPVKIGTTSWVMAFRIINSRTKAVVCDGQSVQVLYNYKKMEKMKMPQTLRRRLEGWIR